MAVCNEQGVLYPNLPPESLEKLKARCKQVRELLDRNASSGEHGVRADTDADMLAFLRGQRNGFLLPRLEPLWNAMNALRRACVPEWPGEPQTGPEAHAALNAVDHYIEAAEAGLKPPEAAAASPVSTTNGRVQAPATPKAYLFTWRDILDALNTPFNSSNCSHVRRANDKFDGPIPSPGRGAQPQVEKTTLLAWWNSLEARFQEDQQRRTDKKASLQAQHNYGRDESVLPEVAGHVQKRRRKKNTH